MPAVDWNFTMRLNLRPLFLFSKAVIPLIMEQRSGSIVCMSSGAKARLDGILRRRRGLFDDQGRCPRLRPRSVDGSGAVRHPAKSTPCSRVSRQVPA